MLEMDLKVLADQAALRWQDNWNFRAYLKKEVDPHLVDVTVHSLNKQISASIDCTKCANCCRQIQPHLTDIEVKRIASRLNLSAEALLAKELKSDGQGEHVFKAKPCPMLQGTQCGIYQDRPEDCASYPHLQHPDFLDRSIMFIENYRVCPIVFNVYEALKTKFSYDPAMDYIGDEEQE